MTTIVVHQRYWIPINSQTQYSQTYKICAGSTRDQYETVRNTMICVALWLNRRQLWTKTDNLTMDHSNIKPLLISLAKETGGSNASSWLRNQIWLERQMGMDQVQEQETQTEKKRKSLRLRSMCKLQPWHEEGKIKKIWGISLEKTKMNNFRCSLNLYCRQQRQEPTPSKAWFLVRSRRNNLRTPIQFQSRLKKS